MHQGDGWTYLAISGLWFHPRSRSGNSTVRPKRALLVRRRRAAHLAWHDNGTVCLCIVQDGTDYQSLYLHALDDWKISHAGSVYDDEQHHLYYYDAKRCPNNAEQYVRDDYNNNLERVAEC